MKKYEVYPEDIYVRLQNLEAWKEFKTRQKRNNLITGFALFFVLMLILTAASRIHYSENLPKVKWGYAMSSSLKRKLYTSGIVSAKSPQPLYGMEGLRIARISVAVGGGRYNKVTSEKPGNKRISRMGSSGNPC